MGVFYYIYHQNNPLAEAFTENKETDGYIPKGATVAVSSVGTQNNEGTKRAFLNGWNAMLERLEPETVIFHGNIPKECNANIIRIKSFQERFKEVKADYGW